MVARDCVGTDDPLHAPPSEGPDTAALQSLGDFTIIRELGRGGMGVVYEAEQRSMGRRVALKVLPFAAMVRQQGLERFRNEVRAAATLSHNHIVSVYSVGEERGVHFYAMQLIRGQSLAEVIEQLRRIPPGGRAPELSELSRSSPDSAQPSVGADTAPTETYSAGASTAASTRINARHSTVVSFQRSAAFFASVARLGIEAAEALEHAHERGVLHRDIKPGEFLPIHQIGAGSEVWWV